jgi:hypothetical protein
VYSHQCGSVFAYVTQEITSRILLFWAAKHHLFSQIPPKKPAASRRPTVEDVTDSENDESDDDFTPVDSVTSSDDDSKFDVESDDEVNILTEIRTSVAMAIADVFRNNGISVGRNLAKILKIFGKIDEAKSRGVI